jgi:hypothetical protein
MGILNIELALPAMHNFFYSGLRFDLALLALGTGDLPAVQPFVGVSRTCFECFLWTFHEIPAIHIRHLPSLFFININDRRDVVNFL